MEKKITLPITDEDIKNLKAGDSVLLTGSIITGRDAAHKRLYELIQKGEKLPVDIKGELIYYVGPAPAKPGYAVGPAGPTSSYRMDKSSTSSIAAALADFPALAAQLADALKDGVPLGPEFDPTFG